MKKFANILFVALFILGFSQNVSAQMSESQIISFVQECQSTGDSQADIVSKLLKRGVSVKQLQELRRKYEADGMGLGRIDVSNRNGNVSRSRMRTEQQKEREAYLKENSYMLQSQVRGVRGMDNYTDLEMSEMMNDEISFLDLDSLLYYQNRLRDESQVFGRDIFNNPYLTFEPSMNIATPENYRLGAGDNVIIDIWGASQETFDDEISPDGTVTIPGVGPVRLSGQSVAQANESLKRILGQYYNDSEICLTLGSTRSIQVQVMGEVKTPGTYTMSALGSAFNALYLAGGINDIGTLREIKVYRNGKSVAEIDVYDYILNGNIGSDIRLQDNDIIVVGAYSGLVKITGRVKRPMFYEMKHGESVQSLLDYSGGFTGDAFRKNIRLIRKNGEGSEYSVHTVREAAFSSFDVRDGDSVYVDSILVRYSNMVELRGAVFHPGMYELGADISSVRDLILAADGVLEDAFTNRAVMHRQKDDLSMEVLSIDLKGILDGTSPDVQLKKNDVLYVSDKRDLMSERTLKISGEVMYPGLYMYADNTTIEDFVLQAGGLTSNASVARVDVFRKIYDASAIHTSDTISEMYSFSLKDEFVVDGEEGFILKPFDEVVVRKSPVSFDLQPVSVAGSVNFAGSYNMTSKNFRLSDLVKAAGGLTELAYAKGARLERTMTEEERLQFQTNLKNQQIALYESSMSNTARDIDMKLADSLLNLKVDIGTSYAVAIDLDEALDNPGGVEDIVLREYDKLVVPQYSSTVKISGEVMHPVSMNFKDGASLKYYIKHAGGYANRARKNRVYAIYMNGSVELIRKNSHKAIQPGCEIVVPTKEMRDKLTAAEWMGMGSTAASISTMMVSIANLLK